MKDKVGASLKKKVQQTRQKSMRIKASNFVGRHSGELRDFYTMGKMLGAGAFGEVSLCTHIASGNERAVKALKKDNMNEADKEEFLNEVDVLKGLDHPNILKMFEYFEDEQRYYIITDLCSGGELMDEITKRGQFNEKDAGVIIKHVLMCMSYCHSNNILHRDLKPQNIMLEGKKWKLDQIKVIDFGLSLVEKKGEQ